FFAHPLQVHERVQVKAVKVGVVLDRAGFDELVYQLVAQPLDVHGVAAGKIPDPLLDLRRTFQIRTADVDTSGVLDQLRLALRTIRWKYESPWTARALGQLNADHVRNDLTGLLDDHHVAHADVLALDFVGVVQAGALDDGAGQFDRRQIGHWRDRAG